MIIENNYLKDIKEIKELPISIKGRRFKFEFKGKTYTFFVKDLELPNVYFYKLGRKYLLIHVNLKGYPRIVHEIDKREIFSSSELPKKENIYLIF